MFCMFFTHDISPAIFKIGSFEIRWYSISYIIGFILGYFLFLNLAKVKNLKSTLSYKAIGENLLTFLVIAIIIGGRLGYVLIYNLPYYLAHPSEIIKVWYGGMSFHGALIASIVGIYIFCKVYKFKFFAISDIVATCLPIGIFFGRIANFINAELCGRPTDGTWGVIFPNTDLVPRHPSQLYESFFEGLVLFGVLFVFSRTKLFRNINGLISGMLLVLYGVFRFGIEFFREPDSQIGLLFNMISVGQLLCMIMSVSGLFIIAYSAKYGWK